MLCAIEAPHIQVQNSHCNKWIWHFMVLLLEEKVSSAYKDSICCSDTYANCSGFFFLCSPIASLLAENLSVLPIFKLSLLLFSEYVLMLLYHHWKRRKEGLGLPRNSKVKSKGTQYVDAEGLLWLKPHWAFSAFLLLFWPLQSTEQMIALNSPLKL